MKSYRLTLTETERDVLEYALGRVLGYVPAPTEYEPMLSPNNMRTIGRAIRDRLVTAPEIES